MRVATTVEVLSVALVSIVLGSLIFNLFCRNFVVSSTAASDPAYVEEKIGFPIPYKIAWYDPEYFVDSKSCLDQESQRTNRLANPVCSPVQQDFIGIKIILFDYAFWWVLAFCIIWFLFIPLSSDLCGKKTDAEREGRS